MCHQPNVHHQFTNTKEKKTALMNSIKQVEILNTVLWSDKLIILFS